MLVVGCYATCFQTLYPSSAQPTYRLQNSRQNVTRQSAPLGTVVGAEDVDGDDMDRAEGDPNTEEGMGDLAPQAQVILTGCWLTMKEACLLMGSLATHAPLPGTCHKPGVPVVMHALCTPWLPHCIYVTLTTTCCLPHAGY